MSELKKCPFCGGEAQVNTWTMHGITESRCFCSNSDCPNSVRTVALATWNTRPIEDALNARIAELDAEVTKCHELQDSYCDRIEELEAAQRWIRTKVKLPDRAVRQFYEVVCLHQDFAELALFSKGRWIIYDGTSVYDITDRVVFWRRRQPLPAEVMDVLNKRQELQ